MSTERSATPAVPDGSHVCWVVGDPEAYVEAATALLADGVAAGRKPVAFGPTGSEALALLGRSAAVAADPRIAFLDGGPLRPETMFGMFREQSALAQAEGYSGLCVVADMDWLLPARPGTAAVIAFELLLDRVVGELDATVVCAYRTSSFDPTDVAGALSVHPVDIGHDEGPQFRLVAGDDATWRLSGEVDVAVDATFASAFAAAAHDDPCVVDARGLAFIDVAGMRTIADTSRATDRTVVLRGASPVLCRTWQLTGLDRLAPAVELVG